MNNQLISEEKNDKYSPFSKSLSLSLSPLINTHINTHNNNNNHDNQGHDIDTCVIYLCSIISLFLPFVGLLYLGCFRLSNFHYVPSKKKAMMLLFILTTFGIIWQTIVYILIRNDVIKLKI